jgi:hypothetical protein
VSILVTAEDLAIVATEGDRSRVKLVGQELSNYRVVAKKIKGYGYTE